ncbi:hypothetical protein SLA2020_156820 [Shorea laevis]
MAHEGDDTGADPMFIGGGDFGDACMFFEFGEIEIRDDALMFGGIGEDAPNMFVGGGDLGDPPSLRCGAVSPLLPPQSGDFEDSRMVFGFGEIEIRDHAPMFGGIGEHAPNMFVGGGDLRDAPSLERGTVSPLLPPQSGSETVGGTDQQQRRKRKNREISEAGQPAEKEGMSKDAIYRAKKKVAQQEVEKEKNDLKAENEELKREIGQLKSDKVGLEMEVLKLKAEGQLQKQTYEGEIKVLRLESVIKNQKVLVEKEKAEKRHIQGKLDTTNQKLQTLTEELPSHETMFNLSAVVAEELLRRAIDFARLNRSAISSFNFLKPETAASRWDRITLNASKVGKGLCKDATARQLALQHWIEAIDVRHRYGHNLHTYYLEWGKSDTGQSFFFWLDLGAGKELDLEECPRSKLRQQCIKYLGPQEREHYEYIVVEGQIKHKQTGELLDTINVSKEGKWIFVMSTSRRLYAAEKKKGLFHHSSFLAGGAALAAGRLEVEQGILKSISAYGGHYYKPNGLGNFLSFLEENGLNINEVKICKLTDDSNSYCDGKSNGLGISSEILTNSDLHELEIPAEEKTTPPESLENDQTETRTTYKRTLSGGLNSPRGKVPKTSVLARTNSIEAAKSYQLGHQLSCTWTSGAGPRIGCVADYPLELRQQALEFVNLSPRTPHSPRTPSASRRMDGFFS